MRWKNFAMMIACAALMIGSAFAQGTDVPGDSNGDKIVSAEEVAVAEKLAQEGKLSADELQEIKHIHEKYPIEITDSANKTVTVYKPIKRIVTQNTNGYPPVFILGAQDKIAAITTTAREVYSWLPGMEEKPEVGKYDDLDYEKIISSKPDVVFTARDRPDIKEKLEPANIMVISLPFAEIGKFDQELRTLSRLLEKTEEAEEFISWQDNYLNQIEEKTGKLDQKIQVFLGSGGSRSDPWNSHTIGSGMHDAVTMAGGHNIVSELPGEYRVTIDPEWVIEKNPEAVIAMNWGDNEMQVGSTGYDVNNPDKARQFRNALFDNEVLKNTSAVRNERIYIIDGALMLGSSTSYLGAIYCAKWFYPELFKDMDPESIHKEFIEKWLGAPYKGIWAYPQED